jgi:hypothetical protein
LASATKQLAELHITAKIHCFSLCNVRQVEEMLLMNNYVSAQKSRPFLQPMPNADANEMFVQK